MSAQDESLVSQTDPETELIPEIMPTTYEEVRAHFLAFLRFAIRQLSIQCKDKNHPLFPKTTHDKLDKAAQIRDLHRLLAIGREFRLRRLGPNSLRGFLTANGYNYTKRSFEGYLREITSLYRDALHHLVNNWPHVAGMFVPSEAVPTAPAGAADMRRRGVCTIFDMKRVRDWLAWACLMFPLTAPPHGFKFPYEAELVSFVRGFMNTIIHAPLTRDALVDIFGGEPPGAEGGANKADDHHHNGSDADPEPEPDDNEAFAQYLPEALAQGDYLIPYDWRILLTAAVRTDVLPIFSLSFLWPSPFGRWRNALLGAGIREYLRERRREDLEGIQDCV